MLVDQRGNELIRAPDRKKLLIDGGGGGGGGGGGWGLMSSDKSSQSQQVCRSIRESTSSNESF